VKLVLEAFLHDLHHYHQFDVDHQLVELVQMLQH
jgi:hypothetical protein